MSSTRKILAQTVPEEKLTSLPKHKPKLSVDSLSTPTHITVHHKSIRSQKGCPFTESLINTIVESRYYGGRKGSLDLTSLIEEIKELDTGKSVAELNLKLSKKGLSPLSSPLDQGLPFEILRSNKHSNTFLLKTNDDKISFYVGVRVVDGEVKNYMVVSGDKEFQKVKNLSDELEKQGVDFLAELGFNLCCTPEEQKSDSPKALVVSPSSMYAQKKDKNIAEEAAPDVPVLSLSPK